MSNRLENLRKANAERAAAQENKEDAEYQLKRAQDAVDDAKAQIAQVDAPKLIGKAFKWTDPDGSAPSSFRSTSLVTGVTDRGLSVLKAEEATISVVCISLRHDSPHEFFEWIEDGFLVEISAADFAAEYARVLALLRLPHDPQ